MIAIANQKGGVGKSTTAVSLGAALADIGRRVLVIDLDPQGNASTGMGIKHEAREVTIYDVLSTDASLEEAVVRSPVEGLDAVPSTIDLAGAEIELVSQFSRELRLRRALEPVKADEARPYDFVFLDCPPSLGLLTVNALAAAEELMVPIQCEYYALEGLGQLLHNVRLVQQNINPSLRLTGIIMTMFDSRTKLSEQVVEEVRRYFGDRVYDVIIPRTVRLSEAPGYGKPITVYDPKSRGAESYRALAREVAERPVPEGEAMPAYDDMPSMILPPDEGPGEARTADGGSREAPDVVAVGGDEEDERGGEGRSHEPVEPSGVEPAPEPAGPRDETHPAPASPEALAASPSSEPSPEGTPGEEGPTPEQPRAEARPTDEPRSNEPADQTPARAKTPQAATPTRISEQDFTVATEETPKGRRVVVIDERAEEAAVQSGQERPRRRPSGDPGVAEIGQTLPQETHKKRKWWQFGKGGEE